MQQNKKKIYLDRVKTNEDGTLDRGAMAIVMADALRFSRKLYLMLNAREERDV